MNKAPKVLFALSGGVDSTVGAKILIDQGYDVTGIWMRIIDSADSTGAEKAAEELNIKLEILDLRKEFKNQIIQYFCDCYRKGLTPNPCVECNRLFKFGYLDNYREANGFDYLATGHYVINRNGRIYRGLDYKKDQSYFLYQVNPFILAHTIFPLGELTKEEVRMVAETNLFTSAKSKDSLDICFIENGDYTALVNSVYPPYTGKVLDINGNTIGSHNGINNFTIGQRHGFETKINDKLYVKHIDAANNTIVVSSHDALNTNQVTIEHTNWLTSVTNGTQVQIKIRYQAPLVNGIISIQDDTAIIHTENMVWAPTPGQSCVVYRDDELLGGGIIVDND